MVGRFWQRRRPGRPPATYVRAARRSWTALVVVLMVAAGTFTFTDVDGDGARAVDEWGTGASPFHRDTDGDGLPDGSELDMGLDPARRDTDGDGLEDGWEVRYGFDPFHVDPDADGLDDLQERDLGSNPFDDDTDQDAISDVIEATLLQDCDDDGVPGILDPDDDNDARRDGDEPEAQRCTADVDGDDVLDGHEAAVVCIELVDCDLDGLDDGAEVAIGYDPLNPDTFDAKILDGVVRAFQEAGQEPSADGDGDGIPDAWEDASGLIDWGPFDPTPGVRDLLVEFVRVHGPDSARHTNLDFTESYRRVTDFFDASSEIRMQWVETSVALPVESRPPTVPSSDATYYADVLDRAAHSDNPYVTTLVMNPQHDQRGVLHLGIAPIRGMLAAVDYGAHTTFHYRLNNQTIGLTPLWESVAEANRLDIIRASGFVNGGINDQGDVFLVADDYTLLWRSFWFSSPPRVFWHDTGETDTMTFEGITINRADLTRTILHEMGHSLGLCHTDLIDCAANLTQAERSQVHLSTMHSGGGTGELRFLASEWDKVDQYLGCPPQLPLSDVARGHDRATIIASKYDYSLQDILDVQVRTCGDFSSIPRDLEPATFGPTYRPPDADPTVPDVTDSVARPWGFVVGAVLVALAAAAVVGERSARSARHG